MEDVKRAIREFILANYLGGESSANLRDDTRLQTSGILDSFATVELSSFLEQQFGVRVSASETTFETFDCIRDIAALIQRKRDFDSGGVRRAS